ncbi:MAG: XRE family transcriptional regulator [Pedobacter sp.]|nr:MAG: XRE family transcriptional regulator [Pedobacter sp.]
MSNKVNKIKDVLKSSKLQVAALALYLDMDDTTISKWNSNIVQPSLNRLDEIGEILELDNRELLLPSNRVKTGLADALQKEYKRLLFTGLTKKVMVKDESGNIKEINNPEMVLALREFVNNRKK